MRLGAATCGQRRARATTRAPLAGIIRRLGVPSGAVDVDVPSRILLTLCEEHGRLRLEEDGLDGERLAASARSLLGAVAWEPPAR